MAVDQSLFDDYSTARVTDKDDRSVETVSGLIVSSSAFALRYLECPSIEIPDRYQHIGCRSNDSGMHVVHLPSQPQ